MLEKLTDFFQLEDKKLSFSLTTLTQIRTLTQKLMAPSLPASFILTFLEHSRLLRESTRVGKAHLAFGWPLSAALADVIIDIKYRLKCFHRPSGYYLNEAGSPRMEGKPDKHCRGVLVAA